MRSLGTKWGSIKHNVSKFINMYGFVAMLNVSGNSSNDTFHKSLELYKVKIQGVKVFSHILLVSSKGCARVGRFERN